MQLAQHDLIKLRPDRVDLDLPDHFFSKSVRQQAAPKLRPDAARLQIKQLFRIDLPDPGVPAGRRIATSFPRVTQSYLDKHKITAHVVELTGSVEVMISLGVADAIVDLIKGDFETGCRVDVKG